MTESVERLDCMSLAVELAAARVRLLSPEKIQERLSQRFKLLRGQRRDQSARQATLRGAIDWSWELLKPVEQSALSQLSVFHGGCTLEAAEAVVDLESFEEAPWVMDVVEALVDHSLLRRVEPIPGQVRYRMLESIRQYAADLASLAAVNPAWYDAVGGGGMLAVVIFLTLLAALFGLVPPPPATLPSSPRHRPPTTAALPWLRRPRRPPGGRRR